MKTVRTVADLRQMVSLWRSGGGTVGLVPTMGAIHGGHLALIHAARAASAHVVVSLFVNPTQFGPAEDFSGYPRDEETDAGLIAAAGADLLFAPDVAEMFPDGMATTVSVSGLTEGLCGDHRPGHFDGVATVVTKLFNQCRPDGAWFGEKDYQQLLVVRRLVRDLDLAVDVVGVPTVREADGLAMSSRNAYLSEDERRIAPSLYRTLAAMAESLAAGAASAQQIDWGATAIEEAGFTSLDYLEVRDAETLAPVARVVAPARVLGAARLGRARLIDNVPVPPLQEAR